MDAISLKVNTFVGAKGWPGLLVALPGKRLSAISAALSEPSLSESVLAIAAKASWSRPLL
jgi:hypothetical protein